MTNIYSLLRNKTIVDILDGDIELGEEIKTKDIKGNIKNKLPYLSGRQICEISNHFGLAVSYDSDERQSRWEYLTDLIDFCIDNGRISDLLTFLLSKEQFASKLSDYTTEDIDNAYHTIVDLAIKKINGNLFFGGNELTVVDGKYIVQKMETTPKISSPAIKTINHQYINSLSLRAMDDVKQKHFDSAITKCRTMLEEVFCYKIEKAGVAPSDSGDIGKLYSQVKELYNMHTDKTVDKRINMLLSGLEKIIKSITEMRNEVSDAHGVGMRRVSIEEHHARLFVNSSIAMADFILSIGE